MKITDLSIGQVICGPSGARYVVKGFRLRMFFGVPFGITDEDAPWKAVLVTEDARTINYLSSNRTERHTGRIEVDQEALEQFTPV